MVPRIPYLPALDGLRAIALMAVLAFHGGLPFVDGGYLPLTSFFVLSGFLITALLLSERARTGGNGLARFWERRVRRLVPAAILGIALVAVYLRFGTSLHSPTAGGDVASSMVWMTNWRFILSSQPYADAFTDPSPVQHYWSLAVEEQFYIVLPLIFLVTMTLGRGRRWLLGATAGLLAVASTLWMAYLHQPGDEPLRVYFGTDTRAAELLIGVVLAVLLVDRQGALRELRGRGALALQAGGVVALVVSVVSWSLVAEYDDRLYEGGLAGIALLAAVVVAAATQDRSAVSWLLAWRPLVWIGRLSYGIYLYHWPIFLWVDEGATGLSSVALFAVRMAITIPLAWASLRYVETPIREGRMPVRIGAVGWANASVAATALVFVAIGTANLPSITLTAGAQEGELPPPPPVVDVMPPPTTVAPTTTAAPTTTVPSTSNPVAVVAATTPTSPPTTAPPTTAAPAPTTTAPPPPPVRVMVVGDSVAANLATGLKALQADGTVVVDDASILGCTYSRGGVRHPEAADWPVPEACGWWATPTFRDRVATFQPDVIVSHIGLNEMYDRSHPNWADRKSPGDPVLDDFIRSEWVGAANAFTASGVETLWLNPPCIDADRYPGRLDNEEAAKRIGHINSVYVPHVESRASVRVVDFFHHLCANGFSDEVHGVANARPDGFHLSDEAATAVARAWLGPMVLAAAGR